MCAPSACAASACRQNPRDRERSARRSRVPFRVVAAQLTKNSFCHVIPFCALLLRSTPSRLVTVKITSRSCQIKLLSKLLTRLRCVHATHARALPGSAAMASSSTEGDAATRAMTPGRSTLCRKPFGLTPSETCPRTNRRFLRSFFYSFLMEQERARHNERLQPKTQRFQKLCSAFPSSIEPSSFCEA